MKCPYCNLEMDEGYIQCRDGVYWSSKKRTVAAIMPINKDSVKLGEEGNPLSGTAVIAHKCQNCKKIIINYDNK